MWMYRSILKLNIDLICLNSEILNCAEILEVFYNTTREH